MRRILIAISLCAFTAGRAFTQTMPPVERIPLPPVERIPIPTGTIHITENFTLGSARYYTLFIDSTLVWPVRGDFAEAGDAIVERAFRSLAVDSIEDVTVLKGSRAEARGACPGHAVLVITTKSGHWRPSGVAASTPTLDCTRMTTAHGR